MYKISVPIVIHERSVKEDILEKLKSIGASRVFLAFGIPSVDENKNRKKIELFKEFIPFFKASGIETGIWLWTFWRSDLTEQYIENNMMVTSKGKKKLTKSHINSNIENHSGYCCPSSPEL